MGFPSVSIRVPKSVTITILLNLLRNIKFIPTIPLIRLGLLNPPEHNFYVDHSTSNDDTMDRPSPSLVPVPIHFCMAFIKKRIPVVDYCAFLKRFDLQEDEETICAICLNGFERSDEIRELSNCSHVFHRECLDSWVDEGQVTCPLCRSMLFPANEEIGRCGGDPWMVERNAFLFGEDFLMINHHQALV